MNKVSGINAIGNAPDMFDANNAHDLGTTSNEPDARELHDANANTLEQHQLPAELAHLFKLLSPQDIEQFYQSYQLWMLEQKIEIQQSLIAALQQKIAQNAALLEQVRPSAIALSTLAQLQASGVADIELLDQLLERGEAWLDRTMQQLAYCERMDLIGESYTEWCRHALEGAYDWIDSIQEAETTGTTTAAGEESEPAATAEMTENLLLQKLMSDDDTGKTLTLQPRITSPLPALDETSLEADDITASVADLPITETVEPIAAVDSALVETAETTADIAAEPIETALSAETAVDTATEAEPVEATTFEDAATINLEIEQEPTEPVAQTEPEALDVIEPTISRTATDVAIDEPDQEELPVEIAVPETIEDDSAPAADDEIAIASTLAAEVEEAELSEPAEAEATPQNEAIEAPAVTAIEQPTDEAELPVDEMIAESSPIAVEVVTPAEDTASAIGDTENILTAVEQEEKEQEAEVPDAPSDFESAKDESAASSPVAEPASQEEISPGGGEISTPSGSGEAAQPPREQPPAPRPSQKPKPGFFKRLLAFLLS